MAGEAVKGWKKRLSKAAARSPAWLRTAQIAKPGRPNPVRGSFGAASPVVHIDPTTMQPREGGE